MLAQATIPTDETAANQRRSAPVAPVPDDLVDLRRNLVRSLRDYARTHPNSASLPAWLLQVLGTKPTPRPDPVSQPNDNPAAELRPGAELAPAFELWPAAAPQALDPASPVTGAAQSVSLNAQSANDPTRGLPIHPFPPHCRPDPLSQAFKNAARLFLAQLAPHQDSS